jgi:hypothetical protein
MTSSTKTYEVRQLGSDVWRAATEAEIATAIITVNKCYRWHGNRMTEDWTCTMGLGRDVREFRCTAA